MLRALFCTHTGLLTGSRLPALFRAGKEISGAELCTLLSFGIIAGLVSVLLDLHLKIPGHAIIRSIFPMALGLALVPRQGAGMVMGCAAVTTALTLGAVRGEGPGGGAFTSLALTGPLLDIALWRARQGWRLYLGFILAGLGSNLAAFLVRGGLKLFQSGSGGGMRVQEWYASATLTYPACGLLAGLLSALVWFQLRAGREADAPVNLSATRDDKEKHS